MANKYLKQEGFYGKACNTILGIGLAGAIIGMHIYMFMDTSDQCTVKEEIKDAVEEIKKAAAKLA